MLIDVVLYDMNKCDPCIVKVWLIEILLKKVRHEYVWPSLLQRFYIYCDGLTPIMFKILLKKVRHK